MSHIICLIYQLVRRRARPDNHQMSTCLNCADISLLFLDKLDHCNYFPCSGRFYHMVYSIDDWIHRHKDQFPSQQCKGSNPNSSTYHQFVCTVYLEIILKLEFLKGNDHTLK